MIPQPKFNILNAKFVKPGRTKIVGIVKHDTAGSALKYGVGHNDTRYLANPGDGRRVSCDFTVERDGSIWKLNPDLRKFYTLHAGRATAFKGLRNGAVTRSTIGIEICQSAIASEVGYPEAQVKSVGILCAWLCQEHKLTPADITTHANIITDGSRSDPRKFPFDKFWFYFNEARGKGDSFKTSTTIKKTPDEGEYVVVKGDSFYAIARKVGMTPQALADLNGLDMQKSVLLQGQVLKVSKVAA